MNTCKNCQHWEQTDIPSTGWGECSITESGTQGLRGTGLAQASSGDGYYGVLHTSPDFGCVQFAPKTTTPYELRYLSVVMEWLRNGGKYDPLSFDAIYQDWIERVQQGEDSNVDSDPWAEPFRPPPK